MKPIRLGDVVRSVVLGRVEQSEDPKLTPGQIVTYVGGWEEYGVVSAAGIFTRLPDPPTFPLSNYLSILGVSGLTAYVGLTDIGEPRKGETVLVSGAAGAVGSLVCQFAKLSGCRTVGIAGTDDKCQWLAESIGCDATINYRTVDSMKSALRDACPGGIDVYFDNVGGPLLQDVLGQINIGARIIMCGAISIYNDPQPPPGPNNMWQFLVKRALLKGFLLPDYPQRFRPAMQAIEALLRDGRLTFLEEIAEGIEQIPQVFLKLFDGTNAGKLIVRVD
jgi:NADPH-dependent curcumin reductase CurA